jgi:hypothetical protein
MWTVQEGFGPIDEGIKKCWNTRQSRRRFQTEQEADLFSEKRYDRQVARHQRSQPDFWKSYWTRTVKV